MCCCIGCCRFDHVRRQVKSLAQVGSSKVRPGNLCPKKVGTFKLGVPQVGICQISTGEICTIKAASCQVGTYQPRPDKSREAKIRVVRACIRHVCVVKLYTGKAKAAKHRNVLIRSTFRFCLGTPAFLQNFDHSLFQLLRARILAITTMSLGEIGTPSALFKSFVSRSMFRTYR